MTFFIKTIRALGVLMLFAASAFSQIQTITQPTGGVITDQTLKTIKDNFTYLSSFTGGAIACVGTPGNTTGSYRQQCQTAAGAVYACNNASGCTLAADWVAQGSSSVTTTTQSGTTYTLLATDCGTRILFTNAAAVTLTVPAGLGATCAVEIVQQSAAGFVTPTASSTTIHQELLLTKTARQYARAFLYATAADVFNLDGSLQ